MKIAVWHNLPSGGGKRALFDHVKGLVQRGHQLEVWCPPTADQTYLPLRHLVPEHIVPLSLTFEKPSGLRALLAPSHWNMAQKIRAMDRHCQNCAEAINKGEFDILFSNTGLYFHTTSIGSRVKLPTVLYLQEPARWLYEAQPYLPWIALPARGNVDWYPWRLYELARDSIQIRRIRIQAREEVYNARAYDRILVNTYFSRETILRTYGVNAKVCYLGIDVEKFVDHKLPRENLIVGLGSFTRSKNISLVIQAVAKLKTLNPTLVWVGNAMSQHYLTEMQQMANELGVRFQPKVMICDRELVDILNRATVMAYASRLEPFGYAPLEANACGLPVVAVAEGGVRETVKPDINGLLVDCDADEMAKSLERILTNPRLALELGQTGRNWVVQYWSLNSAIDRLETHFKEILTQSST